MTLVPHFDLPFRLERRAFVTVEQDSEKDVMNCLYAILNTRLGARETLQDFGTPDLTFLPQPIRMQDVMGLINEQEPRAAGFFLDQFPDVVDEFVAHITGQLTAREVL